jgi:hypothetical protein
VITVDWSAPDDGGSPIVGYLVSLVQSDGITYSSEPSSCDMSENTAVTCTIPVGVLRSTPFSLEWGTSVFAKVVAVNLYGNSEESTAGNGGIIKITPGAPTNLAEVYEQKSKSTIGLTWLEPAFVGDVAIVDYRVSYAEQG